MEDLEGEVWIDIQGYEGMYQVSSKGRVKSLPRYKRKTIREIVGWPNTTGYLQVGLRKNGKVKNLLVHRLVMIHHNPVDNMDELHVNHKDFDITNNDESNLEWCDQQYNLKHYWDAVSNGKSRKDGPKGESHHLNKLTKEQVVEIRRLYDSGECTNKLELSRRFKVSDTTIGPIIRRKTWKDI